MSGSPAKACMGAARKSMVGVYVTTDGDHGFLDLRFQVNGKPIAQTFELAGTAMRVGGVRWTVKCPESGKMVRDLYLVLRPTTRIFVRAMPWACPTVRTQAEKTSSGTCQEAYGSAWRDEWREPPIRPKYMQRRTFKRLDGRTVGRMAARCACEPRSVAGSRYRTSAKAPQVSIDKCIRATRISSYYPPANIASRRAEYHRRSHVPAQEAAVQIAERAAALHGAPRGLQEHALKHCRMRGALKEPRELRPLMG